MKNCIRCNGSGKYKGMGMIIVDCNCDKLAKKEVKIEEITLELKKEKVGFDAISCDSVNIVENFQENQEVKVKKRPGRPAKVNI